MGHVTDCLGCTKSPKCRQMPLTKMSRMGIETAATHDEKPMNRVSFTHKAHTPSATIAGSVKIGKTAISAPKPVATPLPPRNLRNGDHMCPTTAAMPTESHAHAM